MQVQGFEINSSGLSLFKTNKVNTPCVDICLNKGTPPSYNFVEGKIMGVTLLLFALCSLCASIMQDCQ
jgi:hypothetical protein